MKHSDEADQQTPHANQSSRFEKRNTMKFQHYEHEADLHEQARLICNKDSCNFFLEENKHEICLFQLT